MLKPNIALILL